MHMLRFCKTFIEYIQSENTGKSNHFNVFRSKRTKRHKKENQDCYGYLCLRPLRDEHFRFNNNYRAVRCYRAPKGSVVNFTAYQNFIELI